MSKHNDGGPAFPFGQVSEASGMPINGYHNDGMSLRDYFAAHAPPVPDWWMRRFVWGEPEPVRPKSPGFSWSATNGKPHFPESDPRHSQVLEFMQANDLWGAAVEDWRRRKDLAAWSAWPWHYADAMLSARTAQEGEG